MIAYQGEVSWSRSWCGLSLNQALQVEKLIMEERVNTLAQFRNSDKSKSDIVYKHRYLTRHWLNIYDINKALPCHFD